MNIQFKSEYTDDALLYNHCLKTDQESQTYSPHYHDLYEIIFLKEGAISYLTEDCVYPVRKHSLIFTRPGQRHCIRIDENTPYERYNLLFSPQLLDSGLPEAIPGDVHVLSFESSPLMIQLFDKLDFYCEQLRGDALGRILRSITEEVLLNVLLHTRALREDRTAGMHPLTCKATAFIGDNLLSLTGVEAICRHVGVSKSHLYQLFQTDLQTTPKRYILERRLNLARQEIVLGAKATFVCSQCGFSDYSAFFRAYKKHFGYPPTLTHHASFVRSSSEDIFKGHME